MTEEILERVEALAVDTKTQMSHMGEDIHVIKDSQVVMAKAHESLATAAQSMADTFKRAEERQARLEDTNQELYKDKGITPSAFLLVTSTLCGVIILGAVWLTDTSIKATLTSFEAGKKQGQDEVTNGH